MITQRRFLPSISSLLALEAVSRLGSASAAAKDLSLTQSAVSHQLKQLEAQMGVDLIARDQLKLSLTPAGLEFVKEARFLLERLSQASIKLRANPSGGSLNLSILPAFGLNWLAPRLKDFARLNPEVTVNLQTHSLPFGFEDNPAQAAIHYGKKDWPDVNYMPLFPKQVLPVCAPSVLEHSVKDARQLLTLPLLHLETHPDSWERWFHHLGHSVSGLEGMLFDQSSTMTQAAVHGLGVALVPDFLAEDEIERGRLVLAFDGPLVSLGGYFLVWPTSQDRHVPLIRFRNWLNTQTPEHSS
ncbi:MAG: LysR substrate-binding domain-containing protein [Pelagimonas sp.]|uniref:LysR substrate-binding domain-containing protein n=1 Tax=Pelagimonas sp. TaxID=2073170 RepID=UPI003D6AEACB